MTKSTSNHECTELLIYVQNICNACLLSLECPEMTANDVRRDRLVAPITLVRLRERAPSLVTIIVRCMFSMAPTFFAEFRKPDTVQGSRLIAKHVHSQL